MIPKTEQCLFSIIEIKDAKTATHCRDVGEIAQAIMKKTGASKEECNMIYRAGLLHDIGKIFIDNKLLYKSAKLDKTDMYKLYGHAENGMRVLESFALPDVIVDAAWHHHERPDGSGYPDKLKGSDIKLTTKIISVADTIDAITSNRSYQEGRNIDYLLKELDKVKGIQLDSTIVDIALDLYKKTDGEIFPPAYAREHNVGDNESETDLNLGNKEVINE